MTNEQREALITLLGEEDSEVIEAWCNASQPDGVLSWIQSMLLGEIDACWSEDVSDYPDLNLRDKMTLDRFFKIGSFRERPVETAPTICPDCQAQMIPGEQSTCPATGELSQKFECCSCNRWRSIALVDMEIHPERD